MGEETDNKIGSGSILRVFLGLLSAAVVGLFGWVWSAQIALTEMSIKLDNTIEEIAELKKDTETDNRQNDQISKHWKLHSWTRQKINELETASGKPISPWPDI